MTLGRVLFVSKPIVPPFHDGTKCLVRDVARHLEQVTPILMGTPGALPLRNARGEALCMEAAYKSSGAFTPKLKDNLRAAAWTLLRARADIWHFVFAPNPRSSVAGRLLSRARRKAVVQTVASPPRRFTDVGRLLFGDVVVVQSHWTLERFAAAARYEGVRLPEMRVIAPPVDDVAVPTEEARAALRDRLDIAQHAPIFVYPGDIEISAGAAVVADTVAPLIEAEPGAVIVFAYRAKTPATHHVARALRERLPAASCRFTHTLPEVLSLVSAARAVLFPVDDLAGKVDLPIVLLESMSLGVPVIALRRGPLADLQGVRFVSSLSPEEWASAALQMHRDTERRDATIAAQRAAAQKSYHARCVAREYQDIYLELLEERVQHS